MKQIKLNESQLKKVVAESVRRVLKEVVVNTPYGEISTGEFTPTFDDVETQNSLKMDTIDMLSKLPDDRFVKFYWNRRMTFNDPDTVDAIYKEGIKRGLLG